MMMVNKQTSHDDVIVLRVLVGRPQERERRSAYVILTANFVIHRVNQNYYYYYVWCNNRYYYVQ